MENRCDQDTGAENTSEQMEIVIILGMLTIVMSNGDSLIPVWKTLYNGKPMKVVSG